MARDGMTANHISGGGAAAAYEVQRQNAFLLQIDLPTGGKDLIELTLKESDLPKAKLEVITIHYLNEYRRLAGKPDFGEFNFTVHDVVDKQVAAAMWGWWTKVYNPETGAINNSSQYKKDGTLILLSPDGTKERSWTLQGCWLSAFDMGKGDMSKADPVGISCTLQVDKIVAENP